MKQIAEQKQYADCENLISNQIHIKSIISNIGFRWEGKTKESG